MCARRWNVRFRDVKHQDRALAVIRRALASGRTHHAYLFEGPEGVGKEMAAWALAARLLCLATDLAPDAEACGQCASCRLLAANNHPDFHLVHRGLHKFHPERSVRMSKGLFLGIDLIRHFVIEPATMKPTQGRCRAFVIRDAERMNDDAQNALLKTLEEPPGNAGLILVTSSGARLLPTIRSRCQNVSFDLLPAAFVRAELTARLGIDPETARALAGLSGGRLGVALRWQRLNLLDALETAGQCIDRVPEGDPESFSTGLLDLAVELATRARTAGDVDSDAEGGDEETPDTKPSAKTVPTDELRDALKIVFMLVGAIFREALLVRTGAAALCTLPQQRARAQRLSTTLAAAQLDTCLQGINEAERMLDCNVAPQLVGERLAVALLGDLPVVG